MKVTFFSSKNYEKPFFEKSNQGLGYDLNFLEVHLNKDTAMFAANSDVVCIFVNDVADRDTLRLLAEQNVKLIALRCAGFNNVDLKAATEFDIQVVRVPAYSPYSVAEHTLALILTLNRKTHRAYNRVKEGNFSLHGLMGFDLHGKTVGLIGLGKIGKATASIIKGFGCKILGYDVYQDPECISMGVEYTDIDTLLSQSDIISLHCPLNPNTFHLINEKTIGQMKDGVMLINTSRGALIDTKAVINALKTCKIAYLGLDVYEEEADLFFEDLSDRIITDDVFMRLLTFHNVLITGHQAFFTQNAMTNIADITMDNIAEFTTGKELENAVVFA
ncbi:MAG: 2-hydroxyacid dehydrogenase [Cytophagaceae bacterium]